MRITIYSKIILYSGLEYIAIYTRIETNSKYVALLKLHVETKLQDSQKNREKSRQGDKV